MYKGESLARLISDWRQKPSLANPQVLFQTLINTRGEGTNIPIIVEAYQFAQQISLLKQSSYLIDIFNKTLIKCLRGINPETRGVHDHIIKVVDGGGRNWVANKCTEDLSWLRSNFLIYDAPERAVEELSALTLENQYLAINMLIRSEPAREIPFLLSILSSNCHPIIKRRIIQGLLNMGLRQNKEFAESVKDIAQGIEVEQDPLLSFILDLALNGSSSLSEKDIIAFMLKDVKEFREVLCIDSNLDEINDTLLDDSWIDARDPYNKVKNAIAHWVDIKPMDHYKSIVPSLFNELIEIESVLYGNIENYRDHVIHSYRVFLMGTVILWLRFVLQDIPTNWILPTQHTFNMSEIDYRQNFLICLGYWLLSSLLHDVSYPICHSNDVLEELEKRFQKSQIVHRAPISTPLILRPRFRDRISKWITDIVSRVNMSTGHSFFSEDQLWDYFEKNDHGLWSALMYTCALDSSIFGELPKSDKILSYNRESWEAEVAFSMICHSQEDLRTIPFRRSLDIAPLLCLLDEIQDPGRPRSRKLPIPPVVDPASIEMGVKIRLENNNTVMTFLVSVSIEDRRSKGQLLEDLLKKVKKFRRITFYHNFIEFAIRVQVTNNSNAFTRTIFIGKGLESHGVPEWGSDSIDCKDREYMIDIKGQLADLIPENYLGDLKNHMKRLYNLFDVPVTPDDAIEGYKKAKEAEILDPEQYLRKDLAVWLFLNFLRDFTIDYRRTIIKEEYSKFNLPPKEDWSKEQINHLVSGLGLGISLK